MDVVVGREVVNGMYSESLIQQGPGPGLYSEGICITRAQFRHVVSDDVEVTGDPESVSVNVGSNAAIINQDDNFLNRGGFGAA